MPWKTLWVNKRRQNWTSPTVCLGVFANFIPRPWAVPTWLLIKVKMIEQIHSWALYSCSWISLNAKIQCPKHWRFCNTCKDLTLPWILSCEDWRASFVSGEGGSEVKTLSCDKALLPTLILELWKRRQVYDMLRQMQRIYCIFYKLLHISFS